MVVLRMFELGVLLGVLGVFFSWLVMVFVYCLVWFFIFLWLVSYDLVKFLMMLWKLGVLWWGLGGKYVLMKKGLFLGVS